MVKRCIFAQEHMRICEAGGEGQVYVGEQGLEQGTPLFLQKGQWWVEPSLKGDLTSKAEADSGRWRHILLLQPKWPSQLPALISDSLKWGTVEAAGDPRVRGSC